MMMGHKAKIMSLTCGFTLERVTGIEPALSAWESISSPQSRAAELGIRVSASDRGCLSFTGANGTMMAR